MQFAPIFPRHCSKFDTSTILVPHHHIKFNDCRQILFCNFHLIGKIVLRGFTTQLICKRARDVLVAYFQDKSASVLERHFFGRLYHIVCPLYNKYRRRHLLYIISVPSTYFFFYFARPPRFFRMYKFFIDITKLHLHLI